MVTEDLSSNGRPTANGNDRGCDGDVKQAHFVFIPLMFQGHLIPAVDTALLLATHGAVASVVVTPSNTARIRPTLDFARKSGLAVRLVELPLDLAAEGLPAGADDVEKVPPDLWRNYFRALARLRDPLERHLRDHAPFPVTCVVADFCHPWARELASSLKVPRLAFFSMCAFCLLCQHNVERFHAFDGVADDNALVVVPGLPPENNKRLEVSRAQAPGFFRGLPGFEKFADDVERGLAEADGVVTNSFVEMEPEYVAGYAEARKMKVWTVGPVSLFHQRTVTSAATLAARGNTAAIGADECLRWLDGKDPGSVVYVSFGSIAIAQPKQVVELGLGLEASGHPFIWVLKNAEQYGDEVVRFLQSLELRVAGRGMLIRGWAPQVLILSHGSVGGFVTHCGWNSTMEAVTAGLPVVAWPHFSDQFLNAKFAVEVLGIGVGVGVTEPVMYQFAVKEVLVARVVVEKAVRDVMRGGDDGEERRRRARALAAMARTAVEKGGSSYANVLDLIDCFKVGAGCRP